MRLFAPDLYRNFGIGFVAGAIALAFVSVDDWQGLDTDIAPAAQAAEAPQPSGEFVLLEQQVEAR